MTEPKPKVFKEQLDAVREARAIARAQGGCVHVFGAPADRASLSIDDRVCMEGAAWNEDAEPDVAAVYHVATTEKMGTGVLSEAEHWCTVCGYGSKELDMS